MNSSGDQDAARYLPWWAFWVVALFWVVVVTAVIVEAVVADAVLLGHPATWCGVAVLAVATVALPVLRHALRARRRHDALMGRLWGIERYLAHLDVPTEPHLRVVGTAPVAALGARVVDPKVVEIGERLTRRLNGLDDH